MTTLGQIGRWFFAICLLGFGIQQIHTKGFVIGVTLLPDWMPGHLFWAYATGALLIACGVCIAFEWNARLAAIVVGAYYFLLVLVLHVRQTIVIIHDIGERTGAFETLSICGGALVLAGALQDARSNLPQPGSAAQQGATLGRFFLAISMVIFGIGHFQVAAFIASLIPAWIPAKLFLAYFTGVAFIAAGLAFATKIQIRLAAALLGLMFFLWVVLLHAPRVAGQLHNEDEWNSLLVALAMSASAFILAASPVAEKR
jgi:uncharacterized membrane protein YphA (DoxX/SURF4 family)